LAPTNTLVDKTYAMTAPTDSNFTVDLERGQRAPKGFIKGKTVVIVCGLFVLLFGGLNVASGVIGSRRDNRLANDARIVQSAAVIQIFADIDGGISQTFVAKNYDDIDSIHRHTDGLLQVRRNVGDYGVDGIKNLPGREILESNTDQIEVTLQKIDSGSVMTFVSKNPEYIAELRKWAARLAEDRLQREG
jgi:hypothetical protein